MPHYILRTLLALASVVVFLRPLELVSLASQQSGMVIASVSATLRTCLHFFFLLLFGGLGFSFAFKIVAPCYSIDNSWEDVPWMVNRPATKTGGNNLPMVSRAAISSWTASGPLSVPIWGAFGYFEPLMLEQSMYAVPVVSTCLLLVYLFFALILIVNLLIAAFTEAFERQKHNWKFESAVIFFQLTTMHLSAYPVPIPLNLIFLPIDLLIGFRRPLQERG
eukprot:CAMPEP_0119304326 /NCGR_PEP_ID=MMETSP1333-20130426/5576_1 /TAXON_ID=418940 /ORGANISM="Scyphosphaera apsteinii, Strain RCC1455" /LENGTH=220 /DNA_ID=CAMNT_0007307183 /DNA_START=111 /DNA_END=769 /DNA_ORIENTATION=+